MQQMHTPIKNVGPSCESKQQFALTLSLELGIYNTTNPALNLIDMEYHEILEWEGRVFKVVSYTVTI